MQLHLLIISTFIFMMRFYAPRYARHGGILAGIRIGHGFGYGGRSNNASKNSSNEQSKALVH